MLPSRGAPYSGAPHIPSGQRSLVSCLLGSGIFVVGCLVVGCRLLVVGCLLLVVCWFVVGWLAGGLLIVWLAGRLVGCLVVVGWLSVCCCCCCWVVSWRRNSQRVLSTSSVLILEVGQTAWCHHSLASEQVVGGWWSVCCVFVGGLLTPWLGGWVEHLVFRYVFINGLWEAKREIGNMPSVYQSRFWR